MQRKLMVLVGLVLIILLAGCRKSASPDDSPPATTLRVEDCDDPDSCCIDKCGSYCQGYGAIYFRHELNGQTCLCYCER